MFKVHTPSLMFGIFLGFTLQSIYKVVLLDLEINEKRIRIAYVYIYLHLSYPKPIF